MSRKANRRKRGKKKRSSRKGPRIGQKMRAGSYRVRQADGAWGPWHVSCKIAQWVQPQGERPRWRVVDCLRCGRCY